MREIVIQLDSANPVEIFGINNTNISLLKAHFPKLKIIARGSILKVIGEDDELLRFEEKMKLLMEHFNTYHQLKSTDVEQLLSEHGESMVGNNKNGDVIVYGTHGNIVRPLTPAQKELVNVTDDHDLIFAVGPAGTGKTYNAVALAVRALKNKTIKRIILTRPAVEAGEHLGFLPGDLKEKLDPYLQPLYDALLDMIPAEKLESYLEKRVIQIAPLAFMRGRTLDNAYVILDEAQNSTESQMKMFLTRMGKSAKFIINGDITQIDLPRSQRSGLKQALDVLEGVPGVAFVRFEAKDVIRHSLVKKIIKAYNKKDKKSNSEEES